MSAHTKSSAFTPFCLDLHTHIYRSHITDVLQPVAAVVLRQGEADVSALLPAAADLSEPPGHAGRKESQAAQQNHEGKNQDH